MSKHVHTTGQTPSVLWSIGIAGIIISCVILAISAIQEWHAIVQFAFATLLVSVTICILLGSHDDALKRGILVTCGVLAPLWFVIMGLIRLSG